MRRQIVSYYDKVIAWYFNGEFHRDKGLPAMYFFEKGKLDSILYYQHGLIHLTTGPAVINYNLKIKRYWYQDKIYNSLEEMQMVETCR